MLQPDYNRNPIGQIDVSEESELTALRTWLANALLGTEIYWSTLPDPAGLFAEELLQAVLAADDGGPDV